MKKKVMIAMSGGVDSSVAAALLVEQGYEVAGVTMKLWQDECKTAVEGGCCSIDAVEDARRVCNKIGIPHYVFNMADEFKEKVIEYFIDEYLKASTPNPCIACNKYIKFESLLSKARSMGFDYIATGHYAKVEYDANLNRWVLKKSHAVAKDQTYALYNLTQDQLEHTVFPLGEYTNKEQVREIATKLELLVANKPDSQEICFVDDNYGDFINKERPNSFRTGNFVDKNNNVLGRHRGIIYYTIGQRKGLGIALGRPMFVVGFNIAKNEVILGDEEEIFKDELVASDINLIAVDKLINETEVTAKIRYSAKEAKATLTPIDGGKVLVKFKEKQRAITPGQAIVFYDGDVVFGGGKIAGGALTSLTLLSH